MHHTKIRGMGVIVGDGVVRWLALRYLDKPPASLHAELQASACSAIIDINSHLPSKHCLSHSDSSSLEHLYHHHHGWLLGWLRRRLGNGADAADLAHDTFVRLISGRAQWRFDSMPEARAYLRTTAQHLCINLWRRREIEEAWLETLAAMPAAHHPSAERQAMVMQALEEIITMLGHLPPKAARAFTLAVVCDMTDDEVGLALGVSGRMVRKYVAQAMLGCLTLRAQQTMRELSSEPAG
jgi:RNA polymerase sigma factor (sigma-70 family)